MQALTLIQGLALMTANNADQDNGSRKVSEILSEQPKLNIKELAEKLGTNRQFVRWHSESA
jgi:hypothetical protein